MPTLAHNKEAGHHYTLLENIEAGLALTGTEVKSAKAGQINLKGSYVSLGTDGQPWLVGVHISPYKPGGPRQHEPTRRRRLLLHKKEIAYLQGKSQEEGLTIVPIQLYTKGGLVKISLAIGRGKKLHDKRQSLKNREVTRDLRRRLKQY